MNPHLEIKPIDIKHASEEEYRAATIFNNLMRAERLPDDPPIPLDEQIQEFQSIPSFVDVNAWYVWNPIDETVVGIASAAFLRMQTNQHLAELDIEVLPQYRRQGIACRLLALTVEAAQREKRRLFITNTTERVAAGAAFMQRLGAQRGMENHTNQLAIAELNRDLVREWMERAPERASGFEMGSWINSYPEAELEEISHLFSVMNSAPHDNLDLEDFNMTPEQLRERITQTIARGRELWTLYVREKKTGKLAGFTEVFWHPNRPWLLNQAGTGVFPEYRNHGLGRWLKAAMLDKILRERPQVKFVRTGNADSNAPMLKINHELGFKPYLSQCMWQVEVEKAREYLVGEQLTVAQ